MDFQIPPILPKGLGFTDILEFDSAVTNIDVADYVDHLSHQVECRLDLWIKQKIFTTQAIAFGFSEMHLF